MNVRWVLAISDSEASKMGLYDFRSVYKKFMDDYVRLMVSKGYREYSFYYVYRFDKFLVQNNYCLDYISKELIDRWSMQLDTEKKNTRNDRVNKVNGFCRYLNSVGVKAYVSHAKLSGETTTPYILSEDEITALFRVIDAESLKKDAIKHYPFMLPVFFRLLYTCGLRNNEACCLKAEDVDFGESVLRILDAKNGKDRLVYMSRDMCLLLRLYLDKVRKYVTSEWLFPGRNKEKHIHKTCIDDYFNGFVRLADIGNKQFHPVPHSLRHTYVVHRVDSWIQEGKDANRLLIYLSKQLGHKSLSETYYYYHMLESSFGPIKERTREIYPEVVPYEE